MPVSYTPAHAPGPAGWSLAITDGLTVSDLVRVAPTSLAVLATHGVAAGPGARTLADVARRHKLALDELLEELREAATDDAERVRAYGQVRGDERGG